MLKWDEVRRLIARYVGPRVAELGFRNPGRAMWRHRPAFVDVVWFDCRRPGCFRLEFACGVRHAVPNNPAPWDCNFRVQPSWAFDWGVAEWGFLDTEQDQVEALEALAPKVVDAVVTWFGHFATVESAKQALAVNTWAMPLERTWCLPGSPIWEQAMEQLRIAQYREGS